MTDLTEEQLKRIRRIRWAATGSNWENFKDLSKEDVRMLAVRLDALELADHACAEEQLRWLLERLKEDRKLQREWLADLIAQIRIAELQALEADEAVKAVEALIDGGIHVHGEEIIKRWDAVADDFRARGILPADPEPEPAPVPAPEVAPPPEPPPLPPSLVAQLSKKAQAEHAPRPEPAPVTVDDLSFRILAALDDLIAAHGQDLNAMRVAEHLGEAHEKVRVSLGLLEGDGHIQLAKHPSRNMYAILRPGEVLDVPDLSENQGKLLAALVSLAGEDWTASVSRGRLKQLTGINPGSLDQVLWALERKDRIRILDRGNSTTPTKFLITEGARPERPAAPKTDAELIEEALAAGKVTVCPPAHVH